MTCMMRSASFARRSLNARRILTRCVRGVRAQSACEPFALRTARPTSSELAIGTRSAGIPVFGSAITTPSPTPLGLRTPSMKCGIVRGGIGSCIPYDYIVGAAKKLHLRRLQLRRRISSTRPGQQRYPPVELHAFDRIRYPASDLYGRRFQTAQG